jgi:hypothetical protein
MLWANDLSGISERWPEIASYFQNQKAYETARGTLESGECIGQLFFRFGLSPSGSIFFGLMPCASSA